MADFNPSSELAQAIKDTAKTIGVDPIDLATAISYETGGTFDPWKAGPTTQWGQHRGLIQWGEPQAKQYGVTPDMSVADQVKAAGQYLVDRGVKPGHGLMDIYSAINAGGVGLYNRSDANNGGAPGTVADKVNYQMAGHRVKAERLLGGSLTPQPASAGLPIPTANAPILPAQTAQAQQQPQQQESYMAQIPAEQGMLAPPPIFAGPRRPIDLSKLRAALSASGNRGFIFS